MRAVAEMDLTDGNDRSMTIATALASCPAALSLVNMELGFMRIIFNVQK